MDRPGAVGVAPPAAPVVVVDVDAAVAVREAPVVGVAPAAGAVARAAPRVGAAVAGAVAAATVGVARTVAPIVVMEGAISSRTWSPSTVSPRS